jgi:hypothetical protein
MTQQFVDIAFANKLDGYDLSRVPADLIKEYQVIITNDVYTHIKGFEQSYEVFAHMLSPVMHN